METYLLIFIFSFIFFTLLNIIINSSITRNLLKSKRNYIYLIVLTFFFHFLAAGLLKKEVGDVMLFSGAGWHLRHKIDFYWIDSDHAQYPFFPFLIFFFTIFNFLTESFPFFTFSFYLKIFLLIPALFYLSWCILKKKPKPIIVKS